MGFERLAELETFWGSIPAPAHKAWAQRMQHYILDGSPSWQVFRSCPATAEDSPGPPAALEAYLPAEQVPLPLPRRCTLWQGMSVAWPHGAVCMGAVTTCHLLSDTLAIVL